MLRYHLEREGKGTVTNAMAVRNVVKKVYAKYFQNSLLRVRIHHSEKGGEAQENTQRDVQSE